MSLASLFHTKDPDEVIDDCREMWNLENRFPIPLFNVTCPQCGSSYFKGQIQLSRMQFSYQPEKGCPYTADIYFKCRRCSWGPKGFHFGAKILEEMYEQNNRSNSHNRWEWRQIRDYWRSEGIL